MLKIRLQRAGRRNLPHYRVVLAQHHAPIKGKFIKKLGHFDPKRHIITFDKKAVLSWLDKGAKPSNTLARLFIEQGVKHKNITYIKRKAKPAKQNKKANKIAEQPSVEPVKTATKSTKVDNPQVEEEKNQTQDQKE